MKNKGLTPGVVTVLAVVGISAFLLVYLSPARNWHGMDLPAVVGHGFCVAAYVTGLFSCLRAAALYSGRSPIRLGWLAMAGNCLLSIFRHVALNPLLQKTLGSEDRVHLVSQSLQLPALVFLLLGMLAIWWGVFRLGLGFRIRWLDFAGIACAAAMVPWAFRNLLTHAHSTHGALSILQPVSLGLLVSIGGVGLLLHGLSTQMGGGRLGAVMRWIAVYALTRTLLNLSEAGKEGYALLWWMAFYSVPWFFALAAASACWLADSVRRGIRDRRDSTWDVSGLVH